MNAQQRERVKRMIDEALAPLVRATERGAGGELRLREAQRQHRLVEAARRQDERDDRREGKRMRKESRKLFESLGMDRKTAKRAARAGMPPNVRPIEASVTLSEADVQLFEVQRELRGVERKVEKAELKAGRRVFESLGMPKEIAQLAAAGRR